MICKGDWLCIAIGLAIMVPYLPLMLGALAVAYIWQGVVKVRAAITAGHRDV